jgi:hypothetical protein
MTNSQIREEVKKAYKESPQWAGKVNAMTDDQVTAVFMRLKLMGIIKI